ncbi:MAG TPA: hypothetical protein VM049_00390 [Gaiellaceae bacterium]|nr:hypothetical protein [Gaiellaceae bacterium]
MGIFRRTRALHEQLAEQAGLDIGAPDPVERPRSRAAELIQGLADGFVGTPPDAFGKPSPLGEVAIHGVHRPRQWDTVASVRAELPGNEVHFTALPDGTLLVEEEVPAGALAALADAVEATVGAPYRAEGVRRSESVWAVAAKQIEVRAYPGHEGDEIELVEDDHVIIGHRLDGDLFQVEVTPL